MPAQLLAVVAQVGLDTTALTDHDATIGQDEAAAAVTDIGVNLIRGTEMSHSSSRITVHLLAHFFDLTSSGPVDNSRRTREDRETCIARMVENLSADHLITLDDVFVLAPEDGPTGRPHIANVPVVAGAFPDRSAAFAQTLYPSGPHYVHYWAPDPVEAVRCVREIGGAPVLAYPHARKRRRLLPEAVIADMAEAGLFGIECDHRDHTPEDRVDVERMAREMGLAMSGSSGYHGTGKPNHISENMTDPQAIAEVIAQGTIEVVEPRVRSTLLFL